MFIAVNVYCIFILQQRTYFNCVFCFIANSLIPKMNTKADEALMAANEVIKNWQPKSEVWAFNHGTSVISTSTFLSSVYITKTLRKSLKMKSFARLTTYSATCIPPAAIATLLHGFYVMKPLLSGEVSCPVCLETRSTIFQTVSGFFFPLILGPLATAQFADRYMTAFVPTSHYRQTLWPFFKKIFKPKQTAMLGLLAAQMVIGAGMAHWEQNTIYNIVEKINKMEAAIAKERSPEYIEDLKNESTLPSKDGVAFDPPMQRYQFD